MSDIRTALLLSVPRALLDAVPCNLRAVTCGWEAAHIALRIDGQISDTSIEDAHIVGAEVAADFPVQWTVGEELVRLDYPASLVPTLLVCAYRPKESTTDT
ncbi:hypothetical protein NKH53_25565 [Mesorhizobium australicum]|uniref:hypothetical protein n=1 Tax=Mesorhizobium australicum TaxID=536018 RepID=UPI00333A8C9B